VVSSLPCQSRSESGRTLASPPRSRRTRTARGCVWSVVLTLVLVTTAAAGAQSAATGSFKGRRITDVLTGFRAQGLNLVFSDALVPSSLRVTQEPHGTTPRDILTEILAPHGLSIREEARGALLVVKGGGSTAPKSSQRRQKRQHRRHTGGSRGALWTKPRRDPLRQQSCWSTRLEPT
jgi:hypothetical protein